jgi:hypothetical protein
MTEVEKLQAALEYAYDHADEGWVEWDPWSGLLEVAGAGSTD